MMNDEQNNTFAEQEDAPPPPPTTTTKLDPTNNAAPPPPPKTAIVLIDPITDWKHVIAAALALNHVVITVQMPDVYTALAAAPSTAQFQSFVPTATSLIEAGASHALSMHQRDVFSLSRQLQILAGEFNLSIAGVIPLSEVAVEAADLVSSCLGLPSCNYNALELATARRDKGLMKRAAASAGLRVAKYARVGGMREISTAMARLSLGYPIVVKTPAGMSTTHVFICSNEHEVERALNSIVGRVGPDGRVSDKALVEEYISGTEFAVNIMAFSDGSSGGSGSTSSSSSSSSPRMIVTDVWKYQKSEKARYNHAEICNPADHPEILTYALRVAKAVGIRCGAAHVELKAKQQEHDGPDGKFVDPVMIEIGARLSGGRKSLMAQCSIEHWDPFASLIQSHCGERCQMVVPSAARRMSDDDGDYYYFLAPNKFVRHVFLPVHESGRVTEICNLETTLSTLESLHSSAMLVKVGDDVKETTDILTCAGFVWLVGERNVVDEDTEKLLSSFSLVVHSDV